jgi:nitronate monooxygenase
MFCKSLGLQGRALKNKVISDVLEIEKTGGGLEQLIPLISGERIKKAWQEGLVEEAPLMVGQSIGHIRDVLSCRELLEKMNDEAMAHLKKAIALMNN